MGVGSGYDMINLFFALLGGALSLIAAIMFLYLVWWAIFGDGD